MLANMYNERSPNNNQIDPAKHLVGNLDFKLIPSTSWADVPLSTT